MSLHIYFYTQVSIFSLQCMFTWGNSCYLYEERYPRVVIATSAQIFIEAMITPFLCRLSTSLTPF